MCGLSAYILTYTCNTGTRSSFIYEFSSVSLFFFFLSFLNSILIFFYSFIFFFFFFRLIISTRFDFVNVGRNPSCEIWRKNPNSRACARRDAHYNFEKCFSKYVSREINDRSSLTRSIDKIFFLPGLSWTGNKVTLFLKHLCLLFFLLSLRLHVREITDKGIGEDYIGSRSEKRRGGKIERDISQWWVRKISYIDSLWDWFVIVEAMRIGDEYFVTLIHSVYIYLFNYINQFIVSSFIYR